jgi:glycosyl transferase family 11
MVEVQYGGRLGNNLFQYAFGRIVAEELGFAFRCLPAKNAWAGISDLSTMAHLFRDCPLFIPGRAYDAPNDVFSMEVDTTWRGHVIDLPGIISNRQGRHIVLFGHFERMEYYARYRERIRHWYHLEPATGGHDVTSDDIVLSIRRGDSIRLGISVTLDFYSRILDSTDYRRVYICGDVIDRAVKAHFEPYEPVYFAGSHIEQFRFIKSFNKIVQGQSTFSWWAAYLSDASAIYTPRPSHGPWSKEQPDVDLEAQESRYTYIDDVPTIPVPLSFRAQSFLRRQWRRLRS